MKDFFEDLYDEEEGGDPSFSLHDFKKWLSKQKMPRLSESIEKDRKEELKEKFKERIKKKLKKPND